MGMAFVPIENMEIIRSPLYKGCLFCPRCQCHYTPNVEWGYVWPPARNDTSGRTTWMSTPRNIGDACPFCHRKPGVHFGGTGAAQ